VLFGGSHLPWSHAHTQRHIQGNRITHRRRTGRIARHKVDRLFVDRVDELDEEARLSCRRRAVCGSGGVLFLARARVCACDNKAGASARLAWWWNTRLCVRARERPTRSPPSCAAAACQHSHRCTAAAACETIASGSRGSGTASKVVAAAAVDEAGRRSGGRTEKAGRSRCCRCHRALLHLPPGACAMATRRVVFQNWFREAN
jgi:hypothetical protein